MFKDEKTTQIAASFIKFAGGRLSYLHMMKMLYAADRKMLLTYHVPMTYDKWYSMEHGPVLSRTLDYIRKDGCSSYWSSHIKTEDNDVVIVDDPGDDELSNAENRIIAEIYADWGHLDKFQARDRSHDPLVFPEYDDPGQGRRLPLGYKDVLKANHVSPPEIAKIIDDIDAHDELLKLVGA